MKNSNPMLSKSSAIVVGIFAFLALLSFSGNKNHQSLIWSDMEGYYLYLPATFIYDGFSKEAVRDTNYLRPWPGTDKIYTKYTSGVAILESPFFMMAHTLSQPLGYPSDGHSLIYCYFLKLSAIFYLLAGMFLLWKLLLRYYSPRAAGIALFSLFAGTNLYYYTLFQASMSHVYSFFLFAAFIYLTDELLIKKSVNVQKYLAFGVVSGLMLLVRPTSVILLIYPLYRWYRHTENRAAYIKQHLPKIGMATLAASVVWIPQVLYWKSVTGNWFMWSYGDESFKYWKEPKLFRVLFDAWNGWLLYSPIAILPLINLFLERHRNKHGERAIMIILALATYLFASWWAWWFGGAFGHRCYVEYYALLAIPFAHLVEKALPNKRYTFLLVGICLLLIYYNLGLTYHYAPPWDGPNWTYDSVWNEIKKLF
jgi:hypothetical protein